MTRRLPAGVYLVEAREQQIDLRVHVTADETHSELLDQVPRHGALFEVVRLTEPGELSVELRSADHPTKLGKAGVRISRWDDAATARPSALLLGYSALGRAGRQVALATPPAWAKAADEMYEAISQFEAAGDDAGLSQAAYSLGYLQQMVRNEFAAAVRASEIARDAFDSLDDEVGLQDASTLRATAEIELAATMDADRQQAEQKAMYAGVDRRFEEALNFYSARGLALRAEYVVNLQAVRAINVGDYGRAETLLKQSLAMARANKDVTSEARTLSNLGAIHIYRGEIVQAAREYEELAPLIDKQNQPYQYAAWLSNYGFAMIALGDFDRALKLHLEALDLYTRDGEEVERANELTALGSLYLRMGDAARALETLKSAITAQQKASDTIGAGSALRLAGNAAAALGDHEAALEYLRESARIDANPHSVARTRVLLAGELRALRRFKAAEDELAEPLKSASPLVRANALEERARIRIAQDLQDSVIEDLRAAERGYADLGMDLNRIDTNAELSRVLLARGDVAGASAAADVAIAIVSDVRVKSGNPEWRARFLSARYSPFEARIAVELAGVSTDHDTAVWNAFRTSEVVRARSLADELAYGTRLARVDPDDEQSALRARLTSQQIRLESRIQRQDPDDAGTATLRREIAETRAQIDSLQLREGGVEAQDRNFNRSLKQVRDDLPADTAVLAYFVGDHHSYAWLLTDEVLRHKVMDPGAALSSLVERARTEQRSGRTGPAVRELAGTLLEGLFDGLDEKRLLIISDGALHSVPFAALPLPNTDDLLMDQFVLGYAPSLALALDNSRRARAAGTRIAVVSDPVYAPDDRRLRVAASESGGALRSAPPRSPNNLTRLPFSALEAKAVVRALDSRDTIQLAGFDATPDKVLTLRANELAVLHFATHALAQSNSPEQSALFLTEYTPGGSLLASSRLTASEIRRSGLKANLVVLSGCATGDGRELRGEGVLGLTYGFLANGSGSVVASLWPIEDASTARFMSEFYNAYRKSGRAADALRSAQERFRSSSASPVWSSFVVRANGFP